MARLDLEARWLGGNEPSPFYRVEYQVLPNLGCDLVVPPLILAFGPHNAGRIFLLFSVVVVWLGPAFYIVEGTENHPGRIRAGLMLLPFVFGGLFYQGLLSWYSGVGLAFLVLGHQRWLAKRGVARISDYLIHSALVSLLFLWHLSAWFIYGVVLLCHVSTECLGRKAARSLGDPVPSRTLFSLLAALPSFILLLIYKVNTGTRFAVDPRLGYDWGSWSSKLRGLTAPFLSYDRRIDLLVGLLWLLAFLAWFRIQVPPLRPCAANLTAAVIFFALYWIMPSKLGSTAGADGRVLPAVFICVLAVISELPTPGMLLGGLLLTSCVLVRQIEVELSWNRISGRLQSYSEAFQDLPPGSKVLPVILLPHWGIEYVDRGFHSWAAVERGVFVPGLWTIPGQHPLRKSVEFEGFRSSGGVTAKGQTVELDDPRLLSFYDFLWVLNRSGAKLRVPPAFELLSTRGSLTVWKRVRAASASAPSPGTGP